MFGGISNTGVVTSVVYQPMAKCPQCGIPNQVSGRFSVGQTSTFSNMFTLAQNQQIAIHSQCKSLVRTSSNQGFKKKNLPLHYALDQRLCITEWSLCLTSTEGGPVFGSIGTVWEGRGSTLEGRDIRILKTEREKKKERKKEWGTAGAADPLR